jgi:hypothetical protein
MHNTPQQPPSHISQHQLALLMTEVGVTIGNTILHQQLIPIPKANTIFQLQAVW